MIEMHLKVRGIDDPAVLDAMREVPREAFVPESRRSSLMKTPLCRSDRTRPFSNPISSR